MPTYNPGTSFTQTSGYGSRTLNGHPDWHPGVDFSASVGTPIPAASAGTVVYSGYNAGGYGNTVVIKSTGANGSSYYTLYAHQNGQGLPALNSTVNAGDTIGQVGNTGLSTGAHLHFEVLNGNAPVSNSAGGPLGFTSGNQTIRSDPTQFNNWSGQPFGSVTPPPAATLNGVSDGVDLTTGNLIADSEVKTSSSDVVTQFDGKATNVYANGSGAVINQSNATISVAAGSTVTVNGSGDTVNGSTGSITIGGNGQTASDANLDTVNATGATVTVSDNSRVNVFDSNGTINGSTNSSFGAYGSALTVNANKTDYVWIGNNGQTASDANLDTLYGNGTNVVVADNSRVNVFDSFGTITGLKNSSFGAYGSGLTVNANNTDYVWIGNNGQNASDANLDTFNGNGTNVVVAANSRVNLFDSFGTINAQNNASFGAYGSGITVNANNTDYVWIGGNGQNAADSAIDTFWGNGTTVTVPTGSRVNVNDSNGVIYAQANTSFGAYGSNVNVNATDGDLVYVGSNGLTGAADTVSVVSAAGKPATVQVVGGSNVNVNTDGNDIINSASSTNLVVSGGANTINASTADTIRLTNTNGAADTVNVSGDTSPITLDNNVQANIYGGGDKIILGTGDSLGAFGGLDDITFGATDHIFISGTGSGPFVGKDTLTGSGDNTGKAFDGQASGIFVDNSSSINLFGGNDYINGRPGDIFNINNTGGLPDIFQSSQGTFNVNNGQIDLSGSGNSIFGTGIGDSFKVQGTSNPITTNNSSIDFYGGLFSGDTVNGAGNTTNFYNGGIDLGGFGGFFLTTRDAATVSNKPVYGTSQVVALNLAGGQVKTTAELNSNVYFDQVNSGQAVKTGWITAGEGVLVFDPKNTGTVSGSASLVQGFTALSAFDSNHDGKFNAKDSNWNQVKVWVDQAGNASFAKGALKSFDDLGIASINLSTSNPKKSDNANTIIHDTTFTLKNGTTGDIAGVDLVFDSNAPFTPATKSVVQSGAAVHAAATPEAAGSLNALLDKMAAFDAEANGIDVNLPIRLQHGFANNLAALSERHAFQ